MLFIDQNYWVASPAKNKQFYTMLRVEGRGGYPAKQQHRNYELIGLRHEVSSSD
jgi:hypothetical protein